MKLTFMKVKRFGQEKLSQYTAELTKNLPVQQGELKKRLALTEVQCQAKVARPILPPFQSMAKCHPENSMTSLESYRKPLQKSWSSLFITSWLLYRECFLDRESRLPISISTPVLCSMALVIFGDEN